MAQVRIPEDNYEGLALLISLSDESANQLIAALEQAPPKLYPSDLTVELIPRVPGIEPGDLDEIVDALHSIYLTKIHHDIPAEELAEAICDAVEELQEDEEDFDFGLTAENRKPFTERLIRLLNIETLIVLTKALSILRNQENMYCSARVVTDIRSVFGSNPEVPPTAAVLVHILNLTYHHEGKLKDFYLALDAGDIKALREALDRAEVKEKSLRSLLSDKVVYLDVE